MLPTLLVTISALLQGASGAPGPPDPRAAIFVDRGCHECHAVSALGVRAKADVAPDLTFAYADVVNRYGVGLHYFLFNPTGIMRMILASHVHLTIAERDSIARILRSLYYEHMAEADREWPSLTGTSGPRAP